MKTFVPIEIPVVVEAAYIDGRLQGLRLRDSRRPDQTLLVFTVNDTLTGFRLGDGFEPGLGDEDKMTYRPVRLVTEMPEESGLEDADEGEE